MHITGPTLVTVPLHITSNLALGVLQGGGGNRVIHRGRDKDGGDRVEGKEGGEKVESKESRAMERKVEEGRKVQEEEKNCSGKVTDREGVEDAEGKAGVGGGGEEEGEVKKEEDKEEEEVREERTWKPEVVMGGQDAEEDRWRWVWGDLRGFGSVKPGHSCLKGGVCSTTQTGAEDGGGCAEEASG